MAVRKLFALAAAIGLAGGCGGGSPKPAPEPEIRDFNATVFAAGAAINPCFEGEPLSGFWLSLYSARDGAELVLDHAGTTAYGADGESWRAIAFIPKTPIGHELERLGSMQVCGGSGGITIEGSDEVWGSVAESNLSFPPAEGEHRNEILMRFSDTGAVALALFFRAPFDRIESIELSNGQVIRSDTWQER